MRRRLVSGLSVLLFLSYIFLCCFPELILPATVTLQSVEIFKTHEWLRPPTVYFNCKGENKTFLPDVKIAHVLYTFKDEESWQPLTEFPNKKCKRCGFYEEDTIKADDVFGEWEFCPSDFTDPDGKYVRSVEKEFNATFSCPDCVPIRADLNHTTSGSESKGQGKGNGNGMHWAIVILISVLVSTVFIIGVVAAYKYLQKKKREKDQARFLKLFEDGDDIEDELGIGPLGGSF